jgi:ribonuclease HI
MKKKFLRDFEKQRTIEWSFLPVIVAIESLKTPKIPVKVYSDSKYVIDSITKGWLDSWIVKRFKGKKNQDLWMRYHESAKPFKITFEWVKGHAGNPKNERCDVLAVEASKRTELEIDKVYEANDDGTGLF